jgi:hypothetical protein
VSDPQNSKTSVYCLREREFESLGYLGHPIFRQSWDISGIRKMEAEHLGYPFEWWWLFVSMDWFYENLQDTQGDTLGLIPKHQGVSCQISHQLWPLRCEVGQRCIERRRDGRWGNAFIKQRRLGFFHRGVGVGWISMVSLLSVAGCSMKKTVIFLFR